MREHCVGSCAEEEGGKGMIDASGRKGAAPEGGAEGSYP